MNPSLNPFPRARFSPVVIFIRAHLFARLCVFVYFLSFTCPPPPLSYILRHVSHLSPIYTFPLPSIHCTSTFAFSLIPSRYAHRSIHHIPLFLLPLSVSHTTTLTYEYAKYILANYHFPKFLLQVKLVKRRVALIYSPTSINIWS